MRILLVEDEKSLAKFVKKGLEEEYYTVDLALDGAKGLELFQSHPYDLIIVDLMLPKMDGLTLCQKIRNLNNQIAILILTARSAVEDKVKGLNTGADDYLLKPFHFSELSARIRALLRRKEPQQSVQLKIGDLLLDPIRHVVMRGEEIIELTPREFTLLEYLMRNAGYV